MSTLDVPDARRDRDAAPSAMSPRLRKLVLTTHVTCSVGWIGAVAGFLVLSIAGLAGQDGETVRGAYLAMDLIGAYVIVPMSLASLATGLLQALGTRWGLLQHYWVLAKFVLAILATVALMVHQFLAVAEAKARVLGAPAGTAPSAGPLGVQLVGDATLAIVVLLAAVTLSVFKPWGRTSYGRRRQLQRRAAALRTAPMPHRGRVTGDGPSARLKATLIVVGLIVVVVGFLLSRPSVTSLFLR